MTPSEYIQNPMGKGSAIIPNTEAKAKLNTEFEKVRYKIKCTCYILDNHLAIYSYLIPSISRSEVSYNVLLQFDLSVAEEKGFDRVDNLPFLVYSNCPSFIYTYARAFDERGLLIPWIKKKYEKKALTESKIRNTYGIIGYEKSLYIAIRYLLSAHNNMIYQFKQMAKSIRSTKEIAGTILRSDEIMDTYKVSTKIPKENRKEKLNIAEQAEIEEIKRKDEVRNITKVIRTKAVKKVHKI